MVLALPIVKAPACVAVDRTCSAAGDLVRFGLFVWQLHDYVVYHRRCKDRVTSWDPEALRSLQNAIAVAASFADSIQHRCTCVGQMRTSRAET